MLVTGEHTNFLQQKNGGKMPKISIAGLMPFFNGMPTLPLAINSLKNFDQIIIHYSPSSDESLEYIESLKWKNMKIIKVPNVTNWSDMYNKLVGEIETSHFYIVHSDHIIHPDFYYALKENWKKSPEGHGALYSVEMAGRRTFYKFMVRDVKAGQTVCESLRNKKQTTWGPLFVNVSFRSDGGPKKVRGYIREIHEELISGNEILEDYKKNFIVPYVKMHWGYSYLKWNYNHWKLKIKRELEAGCPSWYYHGHKAKDFEDFIERILKKEIPKCKLSDLPKELILPEKFYPEVKNT